MYPHKYEVGEIVYEVTRPQQLMLITRRNGIIYYCQSTDSQNDDELGIAERDLRCMDANQVQ